MNKSHAEELHRKAACDRLSLVGRKFFKYIEFDPQEELIAEIRKHPIGLLFIFLTGGFVIFATIIVSTLAITGDFAATLGSANSNTFNQLFALISFILIVGAIIATFIGAFLYRSNVIYVTSEKIAQVLYISLFNRKISQLSIGDVQDVTVTQKGIIAYAFNYGTLVIETAGEQQNYTFTYVPDPYEKSKLIVGTHEKNLELHGN